MFLGIVSLVKWEKKLAELLREASVTNDDLDEVPDLTLIFDNKLI